MFDKIKRWYKQGLWSVSMVHDALKKGIITTDQYNDILTAEEV